MPFRTKSVKFAAKRSRLAPAAVCGAAVNFLSAHAPAYRPCSHIEIYTCLRVASRNNAVVAFYLPAWQLRPAPPDMQRRTSDYTRGTWASRNCRVLQHFYSIVTRTMRRIRGKNKFYCLSKCQIVRFRSNLFPNSFNKSPFTTDGTGGGRRNAYEYKVTRCVIVFYSVMTALFPTTIDLIERVSIN